jgi:dihydroorotase
MSTPANALYFCGGRVIDPASGLDAVADVVVLDGKIATVGANASRGLTVSPSARMIDATGLVIAPGFVDLHVHLREPGHEYKEDIASGARAAAAGGFTTVCCMPNTQPPNDCRAVTDLIVRRAREAAVVRVLPVGAISQGLAGEALAEMGEMKDAGIVAVSDDGKPVMNGELMRRALEYARTFGLPVVQHCEDRNLAGSGVMNEGDAATRAGLRGQPSAAESVMVLRDLELVALTGARYHVAHVSTAASVQAVRDAKKRGLPVTCEVTPHHLTLTDAACGDYDTSTKCAPPLRSRADVEALRAGLADGTIDCIASDHAPHAAQEKDLEFELAAFGMIGLETALSLGLRLVAEGVLSLATLVERMTIGAARTFGLPAGTLRVGAAADVVAFDAAATWKVDRARLLSKSRNTPFHGWEMSGQVRYTVVGGRVVHEGAANERRDR